MWILPTRDRCERLRNTFLPTYYEMCPDTPIFVVLCSDDPSWYDYYKYSWPKAWSFHLAPADHTYCTEKLNWAYRARPNEQFYGFLSDDFELRSPNMLDLLAESAGSWHVAWPDDGLYHDKLVTLWACGGDLVRVAGWFAYPALLHNCIDSVWWDIANSVGIARYHPELRMNPLHHTLKTAPLDDTYKRVEVINLEAGRIFHDVWEPSTERARIIAAAKEGAAK